MDALTHAVEAYIGRSTTKRTRRLAEEATALIFQNIGRAYENGQDGKAREAMLIASYRAGYAFSVSYVGYVHALAHALGGRYGIPHGRACAILMPAVLEAYGKSAHKKLHRLAVAAGVAAKGERHEAGAQKFIEAVRRLAAKYNIETEVLDPGIDSPLGSTESAGFRLAEKAVHAVFPDVKTAPYLMTGAT
ncbi:MAG: iron-containing alcohol dehydrogenase, partial [Clostridia bacterium]|nr:iron-containing alcohol dehydrogenase [Clostridia bacterium]